MKMEPDIYELSGASNADEIGGIVGTWILPRKVDK